MFSLKLSQTVHIGNQNGFDSMTFKESLPASSPALKVVRCPPAVVSSHTWTNRQGVPFVFVFTWWLLGWRLYCDYMTWESVPGCASWHPLDPTQLNTSDTEAFCPHLHYFNSWRRMKEHWKVFRHIQDIYNSTRSVSQ